MGHLINPISYRLYNIRYWNNNWFTSTNLNYSYLINQDILINKFFNKLFHFYFDSIDIGLIFVNLKIIRNFKNLTLYLYIHDSFLDLLFYNFKKNRTYISVRKSLARRLAFKYFKALSKFNRKGILYRKLKKKLILKFSRKMFIIFLKNKVLKKYWDFFKNILKLHMSRLFRAVCFNNIFILGLSKKNVNASIIGEFFFIRLKQYYTIWEVLKNINFLFKSLMRKRIVKGYKIMCSGRFSRKQRTTYNWKSFGSLASSTVRSKLDYSYRTIALKYSSCTIKVWVRLNKRPKKLVDFII